MENKVSRLFVDTKDDSAKDKLLSVFIIDRTTKTIETLRKQFEATSICRLVGSSNKGTTATAQIKELHATTKIDVLVVDLDTHGALEAIQELSSKIPAIIATSIPEEDDPRLEEARAAGAKYYIERPFSAAELLVAVKETYKKNQSQDVKFGSDTQLTGNIITFLGAKGGVGTTTLALNMAGLLALRSQKFISLVDGDLQSGECANLLGIKKRAPHDCRSLRRSTSLGCKNIKFLPNRYSRKLPFTSFRPPSRTLQSYNSREVPKDSPRTPPPERSCFSRLPQPSYRTNRRSFGTVEPEYFW